MNTIYKNLNDSVLDILRLPVAEIEETPAPGDAPEDEIEKSGEWTDNEPDQTTPDDRPEVGGFEFPEQVPSQGDDE